MKVEIEVERQSRKRKLRSPEYEVRLTVLVDGSKAIVVFAYVHDVDVITARFSDKDSQHQHVLAAVFPGDTGETWPDDKRPDPATHIHANARPYR